MRIDPLAQVPIVALLAAGALAMAGRYLNSR